MVVSNEYEKQKITNFIVESSKMWNRWCLNMLAVLQQWVVRWTTLSVHFLFYFFNSIVRFFFHITLFHSIYLLFDLFSHTKCMHTHSLSYASFNIVRNPGKLYGGLLNVSHMGQYSVDEQFLNIFFKETTIIRRMNVHGIKVRAMVVVSISTKKKKS